MLHMKRTECCIAFKNQSEISDKEGIQIDQLWYQYQYQFTKIPHQTLILEALNTL